MRLLAALAALALAQPSAAQEGSFERGFELGLRYWLSSGENRFSHNAQGADPTLGNPTSILTYEDLRAHSLELHGRSDVGNGWFVKGNAGFGVIRKGSFDDEDYAAGQVKFLDSTSEVRDEILHYLTIDLGRVIWAGAGGRSTLGMFAGFQQWIERVDAYGAAFTVDTFGIAADVPGGVLAITNQVRWRSLRVGLAGRVQVGQATRIVADLALIPYSMLRNEDSHHLRTDPADLGPVPNVISTGRGNGVQLDLEVRHTVYRNTELGIGVRHWQLRSTDAEVSIGGLLLPVNELETRRTGVTASLTARW